MDVPGKLRSRYGTIDPGNRREISLAAAQTLRSSFSTFNRQDSTLDRSGDFWRSDCPWYRRGPCRVGADRPAARPCDWFGEHAKRAVQGLHRSPHRGSKTCCHRQAAPVRTRAPGCCWRRCRVEASPDVFAPGHTGFYPIEQYQGHQFRWSDTAAAMPISVSAGTRQIRINCLPVRDLTSPVCDLRFYLDGARIPPGQLTTEEHRVSIDLNVATPQSPHAGLDMRTAARACGFPQAGAGHQGP